MSKFDLQDEALKLSGVSIEESQVALKLTPSIYGRLGEKGILELTTLFYDQVFQDDRVEAAWFLNIFSSSTKNEAIDNQFRFLVQTLGGPSLYTEKKGKYTRLVGRHANYNIGVRAAHRWNQHMQVALNAHPMLQQDEEARSALEKYFSYTAYYIVAASQFMRPDQLSGGTRIDEGRIW
jgi:truncated hemoglobin YjbI